MHYCVVSLSVSVTNVFLYTGVGKDYCVAMA